MPTEELLAKWHKQRRQQLERVHAAEARAAKAAAPEGSQPKNR